MGLIPFLSPISIVQQKMSGRAIPAAVNWAALLKQTAPADRKLMAAFKLKSDAIAANYAKAAGFKREIDWAHYEANVSKSGFVADFKAQYEATEIPVPSDNGLEAQLEAKAAADEAAVADYIKKVDGQIAEVSVTLNNIKALPPFEQMTQADILYFFPQLCRNQESIFNSENCRHITLLGSRTGDLRMVDGIKWVGFQQADEDAAKSHPMGTNPSPSRVRCPCSRYPSRVWRTSRVKSRAIICVSKTVQVQTILNLFQPENMSL